MTKPTKLKKLKKGDKIITKPKGIILLITRTGKDFIDIRSLDNGIEMRWWDFMWKDLARML